jgi:hypothetical protein
MPDWKKPDWQRPDWQKLVRQHLGSSELPPDVHEEVVAEIAAHLEDNCEDDFEHDSADDGSHRLRESDAARHALREIEWPKLARAIHDAKLKEEGMNNRTKGLWLPALANLGIAAALLTVIGILGLEPRTFSVSHMPMALPLPWLFALPVSGAAAALLAKRAQAPLAPRLLAGLAPSLVALAVFCVMPLVFFLDRWEFSGFPLPLDYFVLSAVVWIVLPILPLLLGALPFLRVSSLQEASRHAR